MSDAPAWMRRSAVATGFGVPRAAQPEQRHDHPSASAVTGQALFYLGETDLAHKLLAIAEDEGVSRAGYALSSCRARAC